ATYNVASAMATAPPPRRPPPSGSTDHRFSEPTPFARLAITHAASICGDVCLTVSLAGSLFFSVSPGQSREKVLLYLIITMAPFAVIAPLLSPLLDRIRGGRRLMILATCAVRGVLCLFIARYVNASGAEALLIYPLAFGLLVMQQTYSIARSALVPSLVGGAMGLLRGAVGFLTFFLAFGLRHNDEAPWVFGLVLVLSGVGGFIGNLLAPQLRKVAREEVILAGSLVLPAVGCLFAARSASLAMTTLGAVLIAAGAAAGRVAFDSLLQRDAPDAIRGRSFARFQTR